MRYTAHAVLLGAVAFFGTTLLARENPSAANTQPAQAVSPPARTEPAPPRLEARGAFSTAKAGPIAIGVDADVLCAGWLGEEDERFVGAVVSAEKIDTQKAFSVMDVVYIDYGRNRGAQDGQELWICRPDVVVSRPDAPEKTMGRIYRTPGRLRIVCTKENSSIAEVVAACEEVEIGDILLPYEPIPIPLVRRTKPANTCDPPSGKARGHIVHARDSATSIAPDTLVFLDLGDRDGVMPGDFLTVFRTRTGDGATRTLLGEAAILVTRNRTAVAKIMAAMDAMAVGDEVELK